MRIATARSAAKSLLVIPLCLMSLAACGDDDDKAADHPLPKSLDDACAQAKDEGTLTMWGGSDEDPARAIFDKFAASHPGIKFNYLSVRPSDGAQKIVTESAAGHEPDVDLVSFEAYTIVGLAKRHLVDERIDWDSLGVPADLQISQNSLLWSSDGQGITYNTDLVAPDEVPTTWDDLLDPKWKGKVVVDPRGRPWDKLSLVWGEDKTVDYVNKLKANDPVIIEGGTAGMVSVGSGEAAITTGGLTIETQEQQADNAPVAFAYLDAITSEDATLNVMAGAKHPNAAYCYAAWLLSDEGQSVTKEITFGPAALEGLPPGATAKHIETPEEAQQVADMSEKIAAIWGDGQ
jgi:iron(III) transport system substrate-binding protein